MKRKRSSPAPSRHASRAVKSRQLREQGGPGARANRVQPVCSGANEDAKRERKESIN